VSKPSVSIVIPVYNEQDNLAALFTRLTAAMDKTGKTWRSCSRTTAAATAPATC